MGMDDSTRAATTGVASGTGDERLSRFELAPPRRFMLPAILLLLSERPGYGYGLATRIQEFRLGHVDRPAVYRALSQLERDRRCNLMQRWRELRAEWHDVAAISTVL